MRTLTSLTLLALFACETGGGGPSGTRTTDDTIVEDDCEVYDPVSESWELTGELTADGEAVVFPVSGKGGRGAGVLSTELTWDPSGYDGAPSLEVESADRGPVGTDSYEIDQPSLTLETTLITGDVVDLIVGEFASDVDDAHYPVSFTVGLTWTDRMDCFEQNNTQAEAKRVAPDTAYEAYNLSSLDNSDETRFRDWSSDDFYTVTAPRGAKTMRVEVSYPVDDGSIAVYLMAAGEDPYYSSVFDYVGYDHGDSKTLEMSVKGGKSYDLYMARWEGLTTEMWALPTEEGSLRPDYWDTPYTFEVRFE